MVEERGSGGLDSVALGGEPFAWAPGEETQVRATGAWMITFADLILLILTFFVMMYSMSSPRIDAWNSLVEGLSTRPDPLVSQPVAEPSARYAIAPALIRRSANLNYLEAVFDQAIAEDPALKGVTVRLGDDRLMVSLPGALTFRPGAVRPEDGSDAAITALATLLSRIDNRVAVAGYATQDESPDMDAWSLSLARAGSVAQSLRQSGYPDVPAILGLGNGRAGDGAPAMGVDVMVLTGGRE